MSIPSPIIAYYVIAIVSFSCSVFVWTTLYIHGALNTIATRLLLLLHASLMWEEVTSLPYVFNYNATICSMNMMFHMYFGLVNIKSIVMLVISYRYHFFEDTYGVNRIINKYYLHIAFIGPMIAVIPYADNSYSRTIGPWCTLASSTYTTGIIVKIFYLWIWLMLVIASICLVITVVQAYRIDRDYCLRFMSRTGMYAIISILCWIPRTATRLDPSKHDIANSTTRLWYYAYLPIYIAGICYTLVFLTEKKALIMFDRDIGPSSSNSEDLRDGSSFSWEGSAYQQYSAGTRTTLGGPVGNSIKNSTSDSNTKDCIGDTAQQDIAMTNVPSMISRSTIDSTAAVTTSMAGAADGRRSTVTTRGTAEKETISPMQSEQP